MESENGVALEDEKCISVEKSVADMKIEDQNAGLGEKDATLNDNAEPSEVVTKVDDLNSSGVAVKASATVLKSKNSKTIKVDRTPEVFLSTIVVILISLFISFLFYIS